MVGRGGSVRCSAHQRITATVTRSISRAPDHLRTSLAASRALRAGQHGHRDRDTYNGKRLNSPNDVVPHPDGSIWFTDPPYGGSCMRARRRAGRTEMRDTSIPSSASQPDCAVQAGAADNVYRWDPSGKLDIVVTEEQVPDPNGILFSPDYKKLYVISTGKGPGDTGPGGKGDISVLTSAPTTSSRIRSYSPRLVDGVKCGPDGMRCDVDGNVWCSSNAGRAVGYSGVTVGTRRANSSAGSTCKVVANTSAAPSEIACS